VTGMTNQKAYKKLVKARADLIMEHPFFASLALRLALKEDPACPTAWTDGKVFAYNPAYVNTLSSDTLTGLSAHSVMHPACGHHTRREDRDPKMWNRACDYAINPILLDAGLTLPDGFLYDAAFKGKTADAVYTALTGENKEQKERDGEPDPDRETTTAVRLDKTPPSSDAGVPGREADMDDSDETRTDPGMSGEVRDGRGRDGTSLEHGEETDWEQALVEAAATARRMGRLPRGIDLFLENKLYPRLPWQELLARFIQRTARWDYAWTTPNRRYIHQNLYFPSLASPELTEVAVVVDTSGSIRPEELDRFAAEVSAILELFPSRLHLIYADMAVTGYHVLESRDLSFAVRPAGGGGTDFRPAFAFLDQRFVTPACLVYLTDMECRLFPEKPPGYPVLWVNTGTGKTVPPFGGMIRLGSDQQEL
jgi:predicted metal-dependent peptidase